MNKSKQAAGYSEADLFKVNGCFPTDGDWLQVQLERGAHIRVCLSRVIRWVLVSSPGKPDRVEAITEHGSPQAALGKTNHLEVYFVKASDQAPNGQTWIQLFNATLPNRYGVRPLSSEQAIAFQDAAAGDDESGRGDFSLIRRL
jgi:hypothetical protein